MRRVKIDGCAGYLVDDVEEVTLELVADNPLWPLQGFQLDLMDTTGRTFRFMLDGVHVGDLMDMAEAQRRKPTGTGGSPPPMPEIPIPCVLPFRPTRPGT